MKKLSTLILLLATTSTFAEVVKEEIGASRNWKAAIVENHLVSERTVCMASVEADGGKARLEVYSEQSKHGNFVEPTVQILLKDTAPVIAGNLLPNRSTKAYAMSIASSAGNRDEKPQVLLARYDERDRLIRAIKQKSTLRLTLYDQKGKRLKRISFSLSGSSKTVSGQFEHCDLQLTR